MQWQKFYQTLFHFVDSQRKAILKTEISTTKEEDNFLLQTELNFLLETLKKPNNSWTKDKLIKQVDQMINKLYDRKAEQLLKDLCTLIIEDTEINKTLHSCQEKVCETLDLIEKKHNARIDVSKGCVCFTFCFDTDIDLECFQDKLREDEEEIRRDVEGYILNKTLMEVFRVDFMHVRLVISKVTVKKGLYFVHFFMKHWFKINFVVRINLF